MKINEIIRKLFTAPEEVEELIARQTADKSLNTARGVSPPKEQGTFLEMSPRQSPIGPVVKLLGCEVSEPVVGNEYWMLKSESEQDRLLMRRRRDKTTVHFWVLPHEGLPSGKNDSGAAAGLAFDAKTIVKFCARDCAEANASGVGFAILGLGERGREAFSAEPLKSLLEERGVFDVTCHYCAYGLQQKDHEGPVHFNGVRGYLRTNTLPLTTVGKRCKGVSKTHVHVVGGYDQEDMTLLDPLVWCQRMAEGFKETGLLKGSKRLVEDRSESVLDSHGRKIVFADSRWHEPKQKGDTSRSLSVSEKSAFSTPMELSDNESDSDYDELYPYDEIVDNDCNADADADANNDTEVEVDAVMRELLRPSSAVREVSISGKWPSFPIICARRERTEALRNMTILPGRETPTDNNVWPLCLRKAEGSSCISYGVEFKKACEFSDGTTKDLVMFSSTEYGPRSQQEAWNYMRQQLEKTYLPEGTEAGRGPRAGMYHGDTERRFTYYQLVRSADRMEVIDWDPQSDCVLHPSVFCTNHKLIGPKGPGTTEYECQGHASPGVLTKGKARPRIVRPVSADDAGTPESGPGLKEILWDVRTRVQLGEKMDWCFRFGLVSDAERGIRMATSNEQNANLMRALIATTNTALEGHLYNSVVVFRNTKELRMPREGYAARMICYAEPEGADAIIRVTEDGVLKRMKHAESAFVSGSSNLLIEVDEETVELVCFSIRSEVMGPKLKELGFPLRQDSCEAPMKGTGAVGKLSEADLTSHGYERKMLSALTVNCSDFGALFRCKQLEGVYVNKAELRRAVMAPGWTAAQTNHAINVSDRYEAHAGLLYRMKFDAKLHTMTYAWCVPKGSVRSARVLGGRHPVSVRSEMIAWFHESSASGFHSTMDATYSKLVTRYHWPTLFEDVERYVKECGECRKLRGRPLVSASVRSDLYDGLFVCVFFDHVGPIRPQSANGHRYLLTCCCSFSAWGWAHPVPDTTAVTTARTLVEKIFCDLCGFPVFVRHDRSTSFLNDVVKEVNNIFAITALVGSAWRPQSQGPLETIHRRLGMMMRTLCEAFPDDWERRIPLAVWAWRITPMPVLGGLSPYRVLLGLEPRSPFTYATAPQGRRLVDVNEYVKDMIEVHESTMKYVRDFKEKSRIDKEEKQARKSKTGELEVGDFVLVLRPEFMAGTHRPGPTSKKLMHRVYTDIYEVHHKLNQSAYILKNASTGEEPVVFQNPINIGRMIPTMTWQVSEPSGSRLKRLELLQEDEETWKAASVLGHGYGGAIPIRYDDSEEEVWIDLIKESYRWLV